MLTCKKFTKGFYISAVLMLALTACAPPKSSADYRKDFPLTVGMETVSLPLVIPFNSKELTEENKDRITVFSNDFINRGNGKVVIETGADKNGGSMVSSRIQQVQRALTRAGVTDKEITYKTNSPRITGYGNVTISFLANTVDVPKCGNWDTSASYNWTNRRHYNYGCATRRNLGLMVADPADLKRAKPVSGRSASSRYRAITNHRAGTPTGSATSMPKAASSSSSSSSSSSTSP